VTGQDGDLVAEVTRLYAVQSHAIDDGDAEGWAATFTEDGEFASPTHGAPVRGRAALRRFAAELYRRHRAQGVRERHWVNNVSVEVRSGEVHARAYLLIVRIGADGVPVPARHVVICDRLVYVDGWRVRQRTVQVDP